MKAYDDDHQDAEQVGKVKKIEMLGTNFRKCGNIIANLINVATEPVKINEAR